MSFAWGWACTARQLLYPREFRIAAPEWPAEAGVDPPAYSPAPPLAAKEAARDDHHLLGDVATGLWRLRQKLVDPETGRPRDETRRAYRHLEATWDALAQGGIEIRDHTGERVPSGGVYVLRTIAFQPTPGLQRETVIETVKPSIYLRGRMIQVGEVVVGTPEGPADSAFAGTDRVSS
jgi:hypothetical protein